jgi:Zinc-finger of C2H2 type
MDDFFDAADNCLESADAVAPSIAPKKRFSFVPDIGPVGITVDPSAAKPGKNAKHKEMASRESCQTFTDELDSAPAPSSEIQQTWRCDVCAIAVFSCESYAQHIAGGKHRRAVAVAGTVDVLGLLTCKICNVKCISQDALRVHMASDIHAASAIGAGDATAASEETTSSGNEDAASVSSAREASASPPDGATMKICVARGVVTTSRSGEMATCPGRGDAAITAGVGGKTPANSASGNLPASRTGGDGQACHADEEVPAPVACEGESSSRISEMESMLAAVQIHGDQSPYPDTQQNLQREGMTRQDECDQLLKDLLRDDERKAVAGVFACSICSVSMSGHVAFTSHLRGRPHAKVTARFTGQSGLNPVPRCEECDILCGTQADLLVHLGSSKHARRVALSQAAAVTGNFKCDICRVAMSGPEPYAAHMVGVSHRKRVARIGNVPDV